MRIHPRGCIYKEAQVCKKCRLDYIDTIDKHINGLKEQGYPEDNGLHQGNIIFRKHTDRIKAFGRDVWDMINSGSHRDQLSIDYVAWKMGLDIGILPDDCFEYHHHKKRTRTYK